MSADHHFPCIFPSGKALDGPVCPVLFHVLIVLIELGQEVKPKFDESTHPCDDC